ncbi:homocysteine-responsive endoplasmic reticulum-resident ubiquitin-like domain member 2 protein [Clavelina lepadiformis]|uniref:homocysteine-responsive endoplasmic reticulum-resident ubiquitin-like domain member 2 protein n=1 Tax=Clavelina lepadiformis TaxID=159417 RepID=UPI0040414EE3
MSNKCLTIIVRSPTLHEDYRVTCDPNWFVFNLKQVLSESYPGKPEIRNQILMYEERCLQDHEVLKTILQETKQEQLVHLELPDDASQNETSTHNHLNAQGRSEIDRPARILQEEDINNNQPDINNNSIYQDI